MRPEGICRPAITADMLKLSIPGHYYRCRIQRQPGGRSRDAARQKSPAGDVTAPEFGKLYIIDIRRPGYWFLPEAWKLKGAATCRKYIDRLLHRLFIFEGGTVKSVCRATII